MNAGACEDALLLDRLSFRVIGVVAAEGGEDDRGNIGIVAHAVGVKDGKTVGSTEEEFACDGTACIGILVELISLETVAFVKRPE